VAIVGEMAIRMSFASRGSERREWRRSGLTRTSTTLSLVYLSLMCRCLVSLAGTGLTGGAHRSDRCLSVVLRLVFGCVLGSVRLEGGS
jgi:hypothetical protein